RHHIAGVHQVPVPAVRPGARVLERDQVVHVPFAIAVLADQRAAAFVRVCLASNVTDAFQHPPRYVDLAHALGRPVHYACPICPDPPSLATPTARLWSTARISSALRRAPPSCET